MTATSGAQFEILVAGKPRSYRDTKAAPKRSCDEGLAQWGSNRGCLQAGEQNPARRAVRREEETMANRTVPYTRKQMGDACEMLVAAELTLAGVPALRVPELWPGYDVIAQPAGRDPQRISVKSRTFKPGGGNYVSYKASDSFGWLAIVLLPGGPQPERRIFVIPRTVADAKARRDSPTAGSADERYWRLDEVPNMFASFEGNFVLEGAR